MRTVLVMSLILILCASVTLRTDGGGLDSVSAFFERLRGSVSMKNKVLLFPWVRQPLCASASATADLSLWQFRLALKKHLWLHDCGAL